MIDLMMSTGKTISKGFEFARNSYYTRSPLSDLLRVSGLSNWHQFTPHANMKDSVFETHIRNAGSPARGELIQRFIEAGPDTKMWDASMMDHIREHINNLQNMTPEQLANTTYTYTSPTNAVGSMPCAYHSTTLSCPSNNCLEVLRPLLVMIIQLFDSNIRMWTSLSLNGLSVLF